MGGDANVIGLPGCIKTASPRCIYLDYGVSVWLEVSQRHFATDNFLVDSNAFSYDELQAKIASVLVRPRCVAEFFGMKEDM